MWTATVILGILGTSLCIWAAPYQREDTINVDARKMEEKGLAITQQYLEDLEGRYQLGEYFEGDLAISRELIQAYYSEKPGETASISTAGIKKLNMRWPNSRVPFAFNKNVPFAVFQTASRAMAIWSYLTCIKFTPWNGEDDFLLFDTTDKLGCFSNTVGYQKGLTIINLGHSLCNTQKDILHEIGHVLGLWHEQARPDRDNYVKIHMENVMPGKEENFVRQSIFDVNTQGFGYDYTSIMHYPKNAFSKNKKDTIEVTDEKLYKLQGSPELGKAVWPSKKDYSTINKVYRCK